MLAVSDKGQQQENLRGWRAEREDVQGPDVGVIDGDAAALGEVLDQSRDGGVGQAKGRERAEGQPEDGRSPPKRFVGRGPGLWRLMYRQGLICSHVGPFRCESDDDRRGLW